MVLNSELNNTQIPQASIPKGRHVRVFISSTFKDMQEERDELVKNTFPRLRDQFKNHRITITEVDMRWGITSEERAEGHVLPICLAEIDYCRPYFIGLIGNYYGSTIRINPVTVEKYPWLADYHHASVVELEIIYGLSNQNTSNSRSFFYFRDSDYLPKNFLSKSLQTKINERSIAKLNDLKQRIRESGSTIRENYPDPRILGQMVYDDLKGAIEVDHPLEDAADELTLETQDHNYFAERQLWTYVPNEKNLKRLDQFLNEKGPPLCVVGGPGSGKTALLASWCQRCSKKYPEHFIFQHYVSSITKSTDHLSLVRRLIASLVDFFNLGFEPPTEDLSPLSALEGVFMAVPPEQTVLIIIDRLDLLEDKDHARDLSWLPRRVPSNIRIMCSIRMGPILQVALNRGWQTFEVPPLSPDHLKNIAEFYLKQQRKRLSKNHLTRIANSAKSSDLLFLRTLLSELCIEAQFDILDQKIEHYLEAADTEALFHLVIDRLERDFELNRPGLIKDSLRLLGAARRGLTEEELLQLLGDEDNPLPMFYWAPIRQALEEHLVDQSGILAFTSPEFKNTVRQRYIPDQNARIQTHLQLADFFQLQPLSPRKVDELPWHLQAAEEKDRLIECLLDIPTFLAFPVENEQYKFELQGYWVQMEDQTDVVEAYLKSVERFTTSGESEDIDLPSIYNQLSLFFQLLGRSDGQFKLSELALKEAEKLYGAKNPATVVYINNLAHAYQHVNKLEKAKPLYLKALKLWERSEGLENSLAGSILDNLGQVESKPDAAESYYRRALAIRNKVLGRKHPSTLRTMHNLSNTLVDKGQLHAAGKLVQETLELREDVLGINHVHTALTRASLAFLLFKQYRYQEAIEIVQKALEIYMKERGERHSSTLSILNLIAVCYLRLNDLAAAEPLVMKVHESMIELHGEESLQSVTAIHNLGNLLKLKGRLEDARQQVERSITIGHEVAGEEDPQILIFENTLAGILFEMKDHTAAIHLYRSVLERRKKILGAHHIDTAQTMQELGKLLMDRGEFSEARSLLKQVLSVRVAALAKSNPAIEETQSLIDNLPDL